MLAGVPLLPFGYLAGHYWINAPSHAELPFHDSFAAGNLSAWHDFGMQQLCCRHSVEIGEAPQLPGERAAKFVLDRSDPDVKGNHRAELRLHAARWGHEYDYTMQIFVPPDWAVDPIPVTVVQYHNVPDLWRGEWGLPSVLRLDIRGDEWVVELDWGRGGSWLHGKRDVHSLTLWHEPLQHGRWAAWRFRINWSKDSDGTIAIWKDDRLVASHTGPIGYGDRLAPYLKFGLYVPSWKTAANEPALADKRTIWFKSIEAAQVD
jgi:hypothetical protein